MRTESTLYRTNADIAAIRRSLAHLLSKADVSDAEISSLEERPIIGVIVDKRVSFVTGIGRIRLAVHDRGSHRDVEIIAGGTSFAEGVAGGLAKDTSNYRPMGASRKLAAQIAEAIRGAGPGWQRVG